MPYDSTSNDGTTKLPTSSFASDPEWMWIDRIYSPTILTQQYNYYGKLNNGFINSVIGQEGVKVMSSGYNYLALNDDVYMYTGVTSISSDQSIIGLCSRTFAPRRQSIIRCPVRLK